MNPTNILLQVISFRHPSGRVDDNSTTWNAITADALWPLSTHNATAIALLSTWCGCQRNRRRSPLVASMSRVQLRNTLASTPGVGRVCFMFHLLVSASSNGLVLAVTVLSTRPNNLDNVSSDVDFGIEKRPSSQGITTASADSGGHLDKNTKKQFEVQLHSTPYDVTLFTSPNYDK